MFPLNPPFKLPKESTAIVLAAWPLLANAKALDVSDADKDEFRCSGRLLSNNALAFERINYGRHDET